jgi:hypothetical protein
MHEELPPVTKLAFHSPEQQPVYFDPTLFIATTNPKAS